MRKELYQGKDGFWLIRGEERRDFTFDKPMKDLKDAMYIPANKQLLLRIITAYERPRKV